jgi:hypothetical protein
MYIKWDEDERAQFSPRQGGCCESNRGSPRRTRCGTAQLVLEKTGGDGFRQSTRTPSTGSTTGLLVEDRSGTGTGTGAGAGAGADDPTS